MGLHLQSFATLFAHARLEIIFGQFHLFAAKQRVELLVEQRQIERIKTLVIIISLCIFRRIGAVDEIIVQANLQRFDTIGQELNRQALASGGLSRRRRPRQQHQFHTIARGNLVGNLRNFLLLQGLAHVN